MGDGADSGAADQAGSTRQDAQSKAGNWAGSTEQGAENRAGDWTNEEDQMALTDCAATYGMPAKRLYPVA